MFQNNNNAYTRDVRYNAFSYHLLNSRKTNCGCYNNNNK